MAIGPAPRTLLASAARTAAATSEDQFNLEGFKGAHIIVNATALADTPSVTFAVEGYDYTSASWYPILTSAAVTTASPTQVVMRIYPGLTDQTDPDGSGFDPVDNVANDVLPYRWRVRSVAGDSDSLTYSVGAVLLP